jgi:hypothetical protein
VNVQRQASEGLAPTVRDTKHHEPGALFFNGDEWQAFLDIAKGA